MNVFELRRKVIDGGGPPDHAGFEHCRAAAGRHLGRAELRTGRAEVIEHARPQHRAESKDEKESGFNARRVASLKAGYSAPDGVNAGTREGAC